MGIVYRVVVDMGIFDHAIDYPCTKANVKFTEPRIMRMWQNKANVVSIYRVYADTTADVLYERG